MSIIVIKLFDLSILALFIYGSGHTNHIFLAPAVTVGETEGAMDSASVFFWPLLLPITL